MVALVGDSARSAAAFERCDLAIGLSSGQSGSFPARADLLAPRLEAVAAIIQAGVRRDAAVRDGVIISAAANTCGAVWGALAAPPFRTGMRPAHVAGLIAIGDGTARLWGGGRARTVAERLSDPQPERWGRQSIQEVMRELKTRPEGLTSGEVRKRWRRRPEVQEQGGLVDLMLKQIKSPVVAVLGAGAALSTAMGVMGDVVMIAAVVAANAAVGAWQEGRAGAATKALHELSGGSARVIRNRRLLTIPQDRLVPGDVILLASGDRVPADARMISAEALEVDEAALTGESIPVAKPPRTATRAGGSCWRGPTLSPAPAVPWWSQSVRTRAWARSLLPWPSPLISAAPSTSGSARCSCTRFHGSPPAGCS
jgi:E1-E2 ATPase/cation transport ATPase-like protein